MWFSECSTETSAWVWIRDLRISQQSAAASYLSGTKIELDHQPKPAPCKTLFIMSTVAVCTYAWLLSLNYLNLSKHEGFWREVTQSHNQQSRHDPPGCFRGTVNTSFGGSIVIVGNGTLEVGAALADIRASLRSLKNACHGQMGWIWWMGVVPPSPGSLYSLYWYIMVYTSPFMDWWPSPNTWQSNVI